MKRAFTLLMFVLLATSVHAESQSEAVLNKLSFDPPLGARIPIDTVFHDETGANVRLADLLNGKPLVLVPVYFECPMLCTLSLNGMLSAARAIRPTAGQDYTVVALSIDPKDTPKLAEAKRVSYLKGYNRPGDELGWRFLTGTQAAIKAITDAIGFTYVYDQKTGQYGHVSAAAILDKDGRITRGLYGPEFKPRDLKLALIEASEGKIGTPFEKVLMYCYAFDGSTGRYSMRIMRVVRLAGVATVVLIVTGVGLSIWWERRRRSPKPEAHS